MQLAMFPGTEGYEERGDSLVTRYESVLFEHKYRAEVELLPQHPGSVLDIGAGTGADAAWLARRGHQVVAAEPVERFRVLAATLHPSGAIEWVADGLPELKCIVARGQHFDVILASAVWMHLDEPQRARAMATVARLLAPGGIALISLRHGPIPAGRVMFEVTAHETARLACANGLRVELNTHTNSLQSQNRAADVEWSRLAFRRPQLTARDNDA
jgi:SAM-dependent methyltransferase